MKFEGLFSKLEQQGLVDWSCQLRESSEQWFSPRHHGDFLRWNKALQQLPEIEIASIDYSSAAITINGTCSEQQQLRKALEILKPWRKGPYQIAGVSIDTEWRSDLKWERVLPHLSSLHQARILDVGCGNGYHCWRMLNESPDLVLGIDPSVLFNMQFQLFNHYIADQRIHLLPLTIQAMPENLEWFDTVFSMGILYHRRSPFDHLLQLKGLLRKGGELCLETLIIEGGKGQVLVPESRYARMNNVWFLPSQQELVNWLNRCGFKNIRVVDSNRTSMQEQRTTEWMPFESLKDCLDADNPALTVEGYPAPLRAVVIAQK